MCIQVLDQINLKKKKTRQGLASAPCILVPGTSQMGSSPRTVAQSAPAIMLSKDAAVQPLAKQLSMGAPPVGGAGNRLQPLGEAVERGGGGGWPGPLCDVEVGGGGAGQQPAPLEGPMQAPEQVHALRQ